MLNCKFCPSCESNKPLEDFHKSKDRGNQTYCKICQNLKNKENYIKNSTKVCERSKRWAQENLDKVREIQKKSARKSYWKDPEKHRKYAKEYRVSNPLFYKEARLKKKYGITLAEYNLMKDSQNGLCAICKKEEWRKQREKVLPLSVDHCHKTGKVRGLLCSDCNKAVGLIHENPETAESLTLYVRKHRNE